jgi:Uma2 family endonuclease
MNVLPKREMTADEFLAWAAVQPTDVGVFELIDGFVVTMQSERLIHARAKGSLYSLLNAAIRNGKLPCEAIVDGPMVRIDPTKIYRPDGLIHCGQTLPDTCIEIPDPLLVYEVLSPDSIERDHGEKVQGYFSLPSVQHYLIIDPTRRVVIHHRRGVGEELITRFRKSGTLQLDPPGLSFTIEEIFERRDDATA